MATVNPFLCLILNIFPGVGLLFVPGKNIWAFSYMALGLVGVVGTFFFGVGLLLYIPVAALSAWHGFFAARTHNKQVSARQAGQDALIDDLQSRVGAAESADSV